MYPEFANIVEKEGFTEIAKKLRAIAKAEQHHEERYREERYRRYLHCWKRGQSSKRTKKSGGFAASAVTFALVESHLKSILHAATKEASSNSNAKNT